MIAGYLTEVYIGARDWTEYFSSADINAEQDLYAANTFRIRGKRKVAGQDDGTFELEGLWQWSPDDGVTEGPEEAFSGIFDNRTRLPVTVAFDGGQAGDVATSALVRSATYNPIISTEDVVRFNLSLEADKGVDMGKVVYARGAITADTIGGAVDLDTAPGKGRAYLHLFALGTGITADVIVEHSDDGATGWATAGTFTQMAAAGWQVIDITTLKRYVRANINLTGTSPTANLALSVHPRLKF